MQLDAVSHTSKDFGEKNCLFVLIHIKTQYFLLNHTHLKYGL